jgi:hypothetical protein
LIHECRLSVNLETQHQESHEFILDNSREHILGREATCQVPLSGPEYMNVSRKHAKIWFNGSNWQIQDLNSVNGTFVNEKRISNAVTLNNNTSIQLSFGGPKLIFTEIDQRNQFDTATSQNAELAKSMSGNSIQRQIWDVEYSKDLTLHTHNVKFLSFSPDGQFLASSSETQVKIWDFATNSEISEWQINTEEAIKSIALFPESQKLIIVFEKTPSLIKLHSFITNSDSVMDIKIRQVNCICINKTANLLCICGGSKMEVWQIDEETKCLTSIETLDRVEQIAFSNDEKYLAVTTTAKSIKIYKFEDFALQEISEFKISTEIKQPECISLNFYPSDNQLLMVATNDKLFRLWNWSQKKEIKVIHGMVWQEKPVAISSNLEHFIAVRDTKQVYMWQP